VNYSIYDHCDGADAFSNDVRDEVVAAIRAITCQPVHGAASRIRTAFLDKLKSQGWPGEVEVSHASDITITSLRKRIGLCLQTGNMARMYADLMKLQTLYLDGAIVAAAIVIPSSPMAIVLGSNIAQAGRLERELQIFKKAYTVPTLVFALE
jgi:hypothetical protein